MAKKPDKSLIVCGTVNGQDILCEAHKTDCLDTGGPLYASVQLCDVRGNHLPLRAWMEVTRVALPSVDGGN